MTRAAELRELPDAELIERLDAAKEELFNLRFQMATGQLDNPMMIKQVRHEIARMLTILRDRELTQLDELEGAQAAEPPSEAEEAPADESPAAEDPAGDEADDEEES